MKKIIKILAGLFISYCVLIGGYIYLLKNPNQEKTFLECVGMGFGIGFNNVKTKYKSMEEKGVIDYLKQKTKNVGNLEDFKNGIKKTKE